MAVELKVMRYDPATDQEPYFDQFEVPVIEEEIWSIMDALDYIHENLDGSLAYYRHSICNHGICARCAVRVNGRNRLACEYPCPSEGKVLIEPSNRNIVKDLVTTTSKAAQDDA
jgi:succinate dehydrogenase/fumarate reductase iron-sulfur protein